ncbi:hypothetical protein [Leucobacter sp. cx-169]|uniref:hypothetical protein n=1 Tax=Leucobacter sp. cx-169 TaxID=2770549 RepID=UPI00165D927C|nr:hypothetical protein [Leucobacter sp. cx-169]MBC9927351.1 hypothetical protein [Leucobacter sp. cx-169]
MAGQVKIDVIPARGDVLVLGTRSTEVAGLHSLEAATAPGGTAEAGFWQRIDGVWIRDLELHPGGVPGVMFRRKKR